MKTRGAGRVGGGGDGGHHSQCKGLKGMAVCRNACIAAALCKLESRSETELFAAVSDQT